MRGYYFITDCRLSRAGNAGDVAQALAAGVRVVQHRDKEASAAAMIEEAMLLRRLCREALFLINDRVDVALAVDADGVHLGQEDLHYREARRLLGEKKIIGITVNYGRTSRGGGQPGGRLSGGIAHLRHPNQTRCRRTGRVRPASGNPGPGQPPPRRHRRHYPG